jgi:hypothetical protein
MSHERRGGALAALWLLLLAQCDAKRHTTAAMAPVLDRDAPSEVRDRGNPGRFHARASAGARCGSAGRGVRPLNAVRAAAAYPGAPTPGSDVRTTLGWGRLRGAATPATATVRWTAPPHRTRDAPFVCGLKRTQHAEEPGRRDA